MFYSLKLFPNKVFLSVYLYCSIDRTSDTHLPIAHQRGVFSHQYVGSKEEDKGMTEAQKSPVQERPE